MANIFVKNNNNFDHVDGFDGDDYVFPQGEEVEISEEAAMHMFGYGKKDKTENLIRLGWANKLDREKGWVKNEEGVKKLAKFTFQVGTYVKVPLKGDAVATAA